jgi:DsbC/DsbD-like thiol-disulfide interchange protein
MSSKMPSRDLQLLSGSHVLLYIAISIAMVAACANDDTADLDGLPKSASTESRDVSEHMRASLLVDASGADDNAAGRVGVLFELEAGWHAYWQNPGETGLPPELNWSGRRANGKEAAEGDFGATQWPTPIPFKGGGSRLVSYGYADQVLLMNPVADFGSLADVSVDASILICADRCIPVNFTLSRNLLAKPLAVTADVERALFVKFAEQVPREATALDVGLAAHYSSAELAAGDVFEGAIAIESCKTRHPNCSAIVPSSGSTFFPDEPTDEALSFAFVGVAPHPEQPKVTLLRFRATLENDLDELPAQIGGVLQVKGRNGEQYAVSLALPFPAAGQTTTGSSIEIAPSWMTAADELGPGSTAETAGALSDM